MKKIIIILAVVFISGNTFAQLTDDVKINEINSQNGIGINPAPTPFSLLDFSRIRWSHSYSVSFFSGGNYSGSMGLLNNTLFYDFSSKLSLAVNIGIAHDPGSLWGDANRDATILPSFQLDYRPSNNFHLSIGMQRYQGYFMPYNNYDIRSPFNIGY